MKSAGADFSLRQSCELSAFLIRYRCVVVIPSFRLFLFLSLSLSQYNTHFFQRKIHSILLIYSRFKMIVMQYHTKHYRISAIHTMCRRPNHNIHVLRVFFIGYFRGTLIFDGCLMISVFCYVSHHLLRLRLRIVMSTR